MQNSCWKLDSACLFFGSNGIVSGGNYHYRVLVHIPILDDRFLRDYLTRNEPKLHVFNLLNCEKKVQRKTDLRIVKMRLVQNGKYFRQIQICLFGIFEVIVNSCPSKVSIETVSDFMTVLNLWISNTAMKNISNLGHGRKP